MYLTQLTVVVLEKMKEFSYIYFSLKHTLQGYLHMSLIQGTLLIFPQKEENFFKFVYTTPPPHLE